MTITSADFITGAVAPPGYPALRVPEFAFFGRSNAGKSSLINMIVNRKALVKTGARPGMTRQINFFLINKTFSLVDLPGYGYARRSAAEQTAFDRMLAEYCDERTELKVMFFLMDMRREPGAIERDSVAYFQERGIEVFLVGTKADKLGSNDRRATIRAWETFFSVAPDSIIPTSSLKKQGRLQLLSIISSRL